MSYHKHLLHYHHQGPAASLPLLNHHALSHLLPHLLHSHSLHPLFSIFLSLHLLLRNPINLHQPLSQHNHLYLKHPLLPFLLSLLPNHQCPPIFPSRLPCPLPLFKLLRFLFQWPSLIQPVKDINTSFSRLYKASIQQYQHRSTLGRMRHKYPRLLSSLAILHGLLDHDLVLL